MIDACVDRVRKGRGAAGNATGRYEHQSRHAVDDGWDLPEDDLPPFRTTVSEETARSAITRNDSPDVPFDRSINTYRGCEHGCVYCYARPMHAYVGLSPGLDFESRLFAKANVVEVLQCELAKPGYRCAPVMLGAATDPYQPIEKDWNLTRRVLKVLSDCNHPVAITTKSASVVRDIDLLRDMAARNLVAVGISVTTLDRDLARTMEPRASTPHKRLEAMAALRDAGVPVSVMASPMIPHLNDHELEDILSAAQVHGAHHASYILLRLPLEVKDYFAEWLDNHAPDRATRVLNAVRETRDGALYQSSFKTRRSGTGPYAELLAQRFALACKRLGLNRAETGEVPLSTVQFRPPVLPGSQMSLF